MAGTVAVGRWLAQWSSGSVAGTVEQWVSGWHSGVVGQW